jgi:hypothetical protein
MRVHVDIDNYGFDISTRNPELLARWLVEIFAEVEWTPATNIRVWVQPGWVTRDGQPVPDWLADSRVLGRWTPVQTPQEFVNSLQEQIDELAKLRAADGAL